MSKKTLLSAAAILVLTALVATPASAQLGGHNFRGDAGLSAGSQPPPGWYFILIYLSYDTDTLRDRNGDQQHNCFVLHLFLPLGKWSITEKARMLSLFPQRPLKLTAPAAATACYGRVISTAHDDSLPFGV